MGGDPCINDLPDDVLDHILSFLTVRDVVKTGIVLHRWSRLCPITSHLDFNFFTVLGIVADLWTLEGPSYIQLKHRFIKGVNRILQLHRGQKLDSLRVYFPVGNESSCHIDRWISFGITMGAEKIDLDFTFFPKTYEHYTFPCHILLSGKTTRLKHLRLSSCMIEPYLDSKDRFNSLKSLDFSDVPLDKIDFGNILSGCSNLERLELVDCILPQTLFISSKVVNLKTLLVTRCDGAENIELNTPNLQMFEYIGPLPKFTFGDVSSLQKVHLSSIMFAIESGTDYIFGGLGKDLPQLSNLSLFLYMPQVHDIPSSMTKFSFLKQLELFVVLSYDFNLLAITRILDACPLLQKLYIALSGGGWGGKMPIEVRSKYLHYKLKEVEIGGFCERWNATELAIYLLHNAVTLDKMTVTTKCRFYRGGGYWTDDSNDSLDESKRKRVRDLLLEEKINPMTEITVL